MWVLYNNDGVLNKTIINTANGRVSTVGGAGFKINAIFGTPSTTTAPTNVATITIRRPDDSVLVELPMSIPQNGETFIATTADADYSPLVNNTTYYCYQFYPENFTIFNYAGMYHATIRVYQTVSGITSVKVAGRLDFYVEDAVLASNSNIPPNQVQQIMSAIDARAAKTNAVRRVDDITAASFSLDDYSNNEIFYENASGKLFKVSVTNGVATATDITEDLRKALVTDVDQTITSTKTIKGKPLVFKNENNDEVGRIEYSTDDDAFELGTESNNLKIIDGNDTISITAYNKTIQFDGSALSPDNNVADLGANSRKWLNLYLNGVLTDGSNSVTVANLPSKSGTNSWTGTNTFTTMPVYVMDGMLFYSNIGTSDATYDIGSSTDRFKNLFLSGKINNLTLPTGTDTLATNTQINTLNDRIDALGNLGRFLSMWFYNGTTATMPTTLPYAYKTGDFFIVGSVAPEGQTTKMPTGSTIPVGATNPPSTTYSGAITVNTNDIWKFDGTNWLLVHVDQNDITYKDNVWTGTNTIKGKPLVFKNANNDEVGRIEYNANNNLFELGTCENGVVIDDTNEYVELVVDSDALRFQPGAFVAIQGADLGTSSTKWEDLYLEGKINDLTLPTGTHTLATTDDILITVEDFIIQ